MSNKPHVGIIGAGLSGLRCADILIQNGARVTILEARDRIGGRVHQEDFEGHLVDLGPNWIHGSGENPIMTIAEATKTITYDPQGGMLAFSREGLPLTEDVATRVSEFVWSTISEAFEYSNTHAETIPPERSLYNFFEEKVEQTQLSSQEKQLVLDGCKLWGAYVGDSIERQSLKFFRLEECVDGSNFVVASTYKRILEYVAKAAQTHADVRLNQPVVSIDAPPRDSTSAVGQHQVTVQTASGERYQLDDVVVTCPLGWLKRNTQAFTPALPPRLLEAINNISYGRLEKVYVTFPQAFWHTANNPTASSIDTPSPQPPATNPVFVQFLQPSYTDHPGLEWNQECLSLSNLPAPCAHPTLLFYTYGACGTHLVTQLADLPPSAPEYASILTDFLQPFYARLPGYDASSPHCTPTALLATRWQADPYAGHGSYCNFQVGLARGDRDIEALREGAGAGPRRGLWFAGEHTAPFVALGTTTGAYWSGERVAARICERRALAGVGVGGGRDDSLPSGK
ncbi:uncharacterized protein N7459_006530 [Penicillium hispanicum]|uniref:uncharacterized protein n=1 Tax=Penicillium hispanicum TaxID=1080232 RepID=UPI002541D6B0|nr:uncharacterized protein N7459_006530 [Penicillium hispanicum]KAJ5577566.1 hypothetical protein N7459_006530 [Penicillium hispanicum]